MKPRLFALIVLFALLAEMKGSGATARELLTSPSQSIRDVGAQILRGSFVPPPRTNWDVFVKRLKPGMKRAAVESELQTVKAVPGGGGGTGTFETREYRLDDLWVVNCSYTNAVLSQAQIDERMFDVWVIPPANFSGDWVTYWVNGERSSSRHYRYGQLDGLSTSYYSGGSVSVVSNYRNGVQDGEETGYFSSGKVEYKGQYKAGKQAGHWFWYGIDGKVASEKDYDAKNK